MTIQIMKFESEPSEDDVEATALGRAGAGAEMASRFLLSVLLITLLAGCGGAEESANPPDEGGAGGSGGAPAAQAGSAFSPPCGGMTSELAAEILGVAPDEVEYQFTEDVHMCNFRVGLGSNVSYQVNTDTDATAAEAGMANVVDGLEFLGDCEPVADLGDDAVYCGGNADRLLVRQGAMWIDIIGPPGLDDKRRAAEQILPAG